MPYIAAQSEERTEHEIKGVLYHEMVHVFQVSSPLFPPSHPAPVGAC